MALEKEILLENGIILNYHRIVSLNKITNISNNIEINSYVNKAQRDKEKIYQDVQAKNANGEILTEEEQELLDEGINVLVEADYIQKKYNANETIEEAYEFLKTIDKYKNGEDI